MTTKSSSLSNCWDSCGCFGNLINSFHFKWTRRRHLWRASFFYYVISWVLIIGIILTFAFHYLITNFSFFVNYSCSHRSIRIISWYIALQIMVIGVLLLFSIFLARMCNIFSNYTLSDFISTGKWLDFFGCTVKWLPWFMSFIMGLLIILQISSLIWIFANPRQWCAVRMNEAAVNAVRNCRLIVSDKTACSIGIKTVLHKEIRRCNSTDYLIERNMMLLALSEPNAKCSVQTTAVCLAYKEVYYGREVDWNKEELRGCLGPKFDDIEKFIDRNNSSDLYKYALLFNITWSVCYFLIVCLFNFIKSVTEFDAIIYQPKDPSESIIIKMIRPLTPWSK
ncbi:hypothetical protein BdWA1_001093 [Babesia duncani]|uniref:Uncharacterized protein n=1 Tax=Babesia duncani TaxID=323732 RepID=A0AAD9PPC2_9APIC|nr:hypothetical protein BdWA1_001093 [Babesia duncani]